MEALVKDQVCFPIQIIKSKTSHPVVLAAQVFRRKAK